MERTSSPVWGEREKEGEAVLLGEGGREGVRTSILPGEGGGVIVVPRFELEEKRRGKKTILSESKRKKRKEGDRTKLASASSAGGGGKKGFVPSSPE